MEEFAACWEGLDDPRTGNAALHDFNEMLVIALCCVLSGGQGAVDMGLYARAKEPFLRGFLKLSNGLPSHDRECPENGGIMPRWLTARSGWHTAEIGGPILSRAFHCRPRSEPEAGDRHLFGTSASAATCSFAD